MIVVYDELDGMFGLDLVGCKIVHGGQERGYKHKILWELTPVGRAALAQSVEKR
jgi:hypothetical protein